jgi:uncharacterized protein YbaR (Trm112 family)
MKQNFICPRCKGYLNVADHIILSAENNSGNSGLILFSPEIGNYKTQKNPNFETKEGEKHEFFCPLCRERLSANIHDNLSNLLMVDEEGNEYQILFSKIAGEKSTYKIVGESTELFGSDKSNYINFINLSHTK